MEKYLQSCRTEFWQKVFRAELDYVLRGLSGAKEVLSVGCGPAIIEAGLAEHGFSVTGLDISREALDQAPDSVRTVAGSADKMEFPDSCFDMAIYIASLQFIDNYREAIRQTARVLRAGSKFLAMQLNPESTFFKEKLKNPDSYVNLIKHPDLRQIERAIAEYFSIWSEYFLGINGGEVFESQDPDWASLYVVNGKKRDSYAKDGAA
jgi:ubiquinone/menaquinone biosynthesis C-methylase UbiE